jgi:hypothetical protein
MDVLRTTFKKSKPTDRQTYRTAVNKLGPKWSTASAIYR